MQFFGGIGLTALAGFVYFVGAIPAGIGLKLPVWIAALAAWVGYSAGAVVVACAGAPLREWLMRKLKVRVDPENPNVVLRAWKRFGLPALGLLAPVTVGPQVGALIALALGAKRGPIVLAIALGCLPWAAGFATLVALGFRLAK